MELRTKVGSLPEMLADCRTSPTPANLYWSLTADPHQGEKAQRVVWAVAMAAVKATVQHVPRFQPPQGRGANFPVLSMVPSPI